MEHVIEGRKPWPAMALGKICLPEEQPLDLIGIEQSGTFDQDDIDRMAKEGKIVQTIGFGQAVFRQRLPE